MNPKSWRKINVRVRIYTGIADSLNAKVFEPFFTTKEEGSGLGLSIAARDAYFWATHAGAELDLLVMAEGRRFGFEFRYADAPGRSSRRDLERISRF